MCPAIGTTGNNYGAEQTYDIREPTNSAEPLRQDSDINRVKVENDVTKIASRPFSAADSGGVGMALGLFLPLVVVMCLGIWIFYAYRNPHTKSGQLLIQVSI